MRLTLAQLEAFFWVAQLGSVQLAAAKLNLAQPTISLRLRDLEAVLGVHLFEKNGRGLRPTEDGLKLRHHAASVLGEIDKIRDQAGAPQVRGVIRVGFAEGFAMVCLAPILKALRADYPLLRPELVVSMTSALEKDLIARRLDLAFLANPVGHPSLQLQALGTQAIVWAASPSMGLPTKVRPADLKSVPIITNPPPSPMYRQISDWFATSGLEPARLDICTSVALVAHLVSEGAAIGLLPHKMIETAIAAGTIKALTAIPPVEDGSVYAASWSGEQTNASVAIVKSVRKTLASMDYLLVTETS
jgi:DNA-binding transcriptional LysR family regulator